MSNYDLQAELSRQQSINRELRGELSELASGVGQAYNSMSNYQDKVNNALSASANRISTSHQNIIDAYELQMEIDKLYLRFKQSELANKKIRDCNNKKYYDFANYSTVRKIVQGMLDNLNLNMISDAIIYKAVEKKHLQTPDYWLTSVLLSIMAWKNDDKELAERAIDISVKLDKKNSSIFYMLFNIRMNREEAALKWFRLYQECEQKGSDQDTFLMFFTMLSNTIKDNVDDKIKYEISDYINKIVEQTTSSEDFDEQAILDRIELYLTRMKGTDQLQTTMLKRCLGDYSQMADIVVSAQNNINILQFILDVGNVSEVDRSGYIDQFINTEIEKPNDVEIGVYDEIAYNEQIIACNGDVEQAKEIFNARQEHNAHELNLIAEMTEWIHGRNQDDKVNGQVRKNMFVLTKEFQRKAAEQYIDHYRARRTDVHPAELGGYSTNVDFNNRTDEGRKIKTFFELERDRQLKEISGKGILIGIILAVIGIGLCVYTKALPCLIISLVGAIVAIYTVLSNKSQRKHIHETCELNIKNKNAAMDQLFEEYKQYLLEYEDADAYAEKVLEEIGMV